MPIKKRIESLERKLNMREKVIKVWDVKLGNEEEQIDDIKSCKVINRDGSYFSENDFNYFLDFDLCAPEGFKKSGQKYVDFGETNEDEQN